MTENRKAVRNRLLGSLVILLVAAVAVQSYMLVRIYQRDAQSGRAENTKSQLRLVPNASAAPTAPSPPSGQSSAQRAPSPFGQFGLDPDDSWWDWDPDHWDPFAEMQRMRQQMSRLFDDSFSRFRLSPGFSGQGQDWSFAPSLDVKEEGNQYVVRIDVPGVDKSDLSVNIKDRQLSVSGQIDETKEEKDANQFLRKERRTGRFERSITLPGPVDAHGMSADYDAGVLTVTIPKKKEPSNTKRIEVT